MLWGRSASFTMKEEGSCVCCGSRPRVGDSAGSSSRGSRELKATEHRCGDVATRRAMDALLPQSVSRSSTWPSGGPFSIGVKSTMLPCIAARPARRAGASPSRRRGNLCGQVRNEARFVLARRPWVGTKSGTTPIDAAIRTIGPHRKYASMRNAAAARGAHTAGVCVVPRGRGAEADERKVRPAARWAARASSASRSRA